MNLTHYKNILVVVVYYIVYSKNIVRVKLHHVKIQRTNEHIVFIFYFEVIICKRCCIFYFAAFVLASSFCFA